MEVRELPVIWENVLTDRSCGRNYLMEDKKQRDRQRVIMTQYRP